MLIDIDSCLPGQVGCGVVLEREERESVCAAGRSEAQQREVAKVIAGNGVIFAGTRVG